MIRQKRVICNKNYSFFCFIKKYNQVMQVYIEYVIIDNLIIDYLLLSLSLRVSNCKTNKFRLFLSSLIGTVVAVIMPLLNIDNIYLIMIKLVLAILMCYIAGSFLSFKKYFITFLSFLGFTFLSGGVIIAIFYLSDVDYTKGFNFNYNGIFPIGVTILIMYALYFALKNLITKLLKIKSINPFIRKCIVVVKGKRFSVIGFIDSGNRLFDIKTGLPIIVGSKNLFLKIENLKIILKDAGNIQIKTVGGNSRIKIYFIDKLLIYNEQKVNIYNNVLIGRADSDFYDDVKYDLLLNPSLIEGE